MNIAVLVKSSIDVNMLRIDSSGNLLLNDTPLAISEYDRNAIEEAVKIKEGKGGKVSALSILTWGPIQKRVSEAETVLREALAMGADEAHLVVDEKLVSAEVHTTAVAMKALIEKTGPYDLILAGEASMDMLSSQFVPRLGELLGINTLTFVRKLEVLNGSIKATRDLEDVFEVVEAPLPAIISVTGEINKPRLPTLLQIRRSFAKPLTKYNLENLGIELPRKITIESIDLVTVTRKNEIITGENLEEIASRLIDKLMEEGVIKR